MIRTIGVFDDQDIQEVTLTAAAGAIAKVMTYGAVLRDLQVPLPDGSLQRVVLGFAKFEDYPAYGSNFGAIPGRYANRIAKGRFTLDGQSYQLPINNGDNHLHGGVKGFAKRPWRIVSHSARSVTLLLHSPDGDAGYPGALTVLCTYTLEEPANLRIDLAATTDAPTVLNLCHHSYFNLDGSPDIAGHSLQVEADAMTPVDTGGIPTGAIDLVAGTRFDFREPRSIGLSVDGAPVLYDNNFVLRKRRGDFSKVAIASSPKNGLAMQVWSTEAGLQVYDGHKLNTPVPGLSGDRYGARAGLALEAQFFPDTPNHPHFGDCTLRPGEVYRQRTEYRFI